MNTLALTILTQPLRNLKIAELFLSCLERVEHIIERLVGLQVIQFPQLVGIKNNQSVTGETTMNIDLATLKAHAQGRWHNIHATLGIPTELLNTHKHQPCPYCGGKDRFRYTDHMNNGGFICNQCTPQGGSGFDLLMLVLGYSFSEAIQAVASVLGMGKPITTPPPIKPPVSVSKPVYDKQAILSLLAQTALIDDSSPVIGYLQQRGLDRQRIASHISPLRFHPALPYWTPSTQGKPLHLGNFPAMLAPITTLSGELMGIHCTYLHQQPQGRWHKLVLPHPQTGEPLPAKKMHSRYAGALTGAAVQLCPVHTTLGITEGIETALAAHQLFQVPVWACLSAHGVQNWQIPPEVRLLVIFADHDEAGITASHKLERRALQHGLQVKYWQASTPDFDVLDELNHLKKYGCLNTSQTAA